MSVEHPQSERDDNLFSQDFAAMFDHLNDQMRDPHVEMIHQNARNAAEYVDTHRGTAKEELEPLINLIDQRWNYINEILTVTAPMWLINNQDGSYLGIASLVNQDVKSRGFTIMRKGVADTQEELEKFPYKAAHYVHIAPSGEWPKGTHGVIFLDDITHLALPYPSEEMRAKNLKYLHPEITSKIDDIIEHVGRPDQTPKALADLVVMTDAYTEEGRELLIDVASYLNMLMQIDIGANYRMEVEGAMVRIDDDDSMFSFVEDEPVRLVTNIAHISLFPSVEKIALEGEGIQPYEVYINLITLESEPSKSSETLMIPASAIRWICSSRYDRDMPPTYDPEVLHE
ncbi:MAG: hypothetical protein ABIP74_03495 [Candidatus Saccharimonas sp.]